MSESTFLIKNYLHSRKSGKMTSLITQVEEIAHMVARALRADFVAVFYRKPDYENLVPLAFRNQSTSAITELTELENHWRDAGSHGGRIERSYLLLGGDRPDRVEPPDKFAAQHDFRVCLPCPCYDGDNLRSMIVAYWSDDGTQPALDENKSSVIETALNLLKETMTGTEEIQILTDYSIRLSELIAMFELSVNDFRLEDLVSELSSFVKKAAPLCQYTLMVQAESQQAFRVEAGSPREANHEGLVAMLGGELSLFCSEIEKTDSGRGNWKHVTASFVEPYSYVYLCPLCFDSAVKFVLAIWSTAPRPLSQNDRELLSIYSLFSQIILKDALLLKNLTKANQLLKKSSRQLANLESLAALADMTSGVAHDFNNMIGGVVGRIQLMKLKVKDAAIITDLNKIESQVLEGAETIRRIQEFTTSAKNKKLQKINLMEAVKDYFANPELAWKKTSTPKNVSVSIKSYVADATIEGAREDITLVLEKLVENAVEFARNESTVEVVLAEERKYFTLCVTNKGPVIPENIRKKIFYPFFTTKGTHGSGMGLAIVHGIIVRHGV